MLREARSPDWEAQQAERARKLVALVEDFESGALRLEDLEPSLLSRLRECLARSAPALNPEGANSAAGRYRFEDLDPARPGRVTSMSGQLFQDGLFVPLVGTKLARAIVSALDRSTETDAVQARLYRYLRDRKAFRIPESSTAEQATWGFYSSPALHGPTLDTAILAAIRNEAEGS